MRNLYTAPDIEILLFDEDEVLTTSTQQTEGYTAAMDVNTQLETILGGGNKSGSITTVRLEDIQTR